MEKRRNCSLGAISPFFHNIFYLLLDFHVKAETRFSLRDKQFFEISEFEIARVNCKYFSYLFMRTYVVVTHYSARLFSIHNICFWINKKNISTFQLKKCTLLYKTSFFQPEILRLFFIKDTLHRHLFHRRKKKKKKKRSGLACDTLSHDS